MNSAKEAVQKILHRDQQHDTEVRETFAPAITKKIVVPVKKVEEVVAIDREVHVDHYQTRIQPIEDRVHEKERHEHHVVPVEHRERKLGNHEHIHHRLHEEKEQLRDTTTVLPTHHEKIEGGVLQAEHIHHHVYERVQPVIEREIVQSTVVHTTVPIHEKIVHEPTIHPATVQPKMTMEEFRRAGGALQGKPEVRDVFSGEPTVRENGGAHETHPNVHREGGLLHHDSHDHHHHDHRTDGVGSTGPHRHGLGSNSSHGDGLGHHESGRVLEKDKSRRGLRSDSSNPNVGTY